MKLRTRVLALLMSVLMALTSPVQALAEGEAGDYLGEVYVAVAGTADEAAKVLEEKGYTVLKSDDGRPADLNKGANSTLKKDAAVVLGYMTTGNRGEAITDLAVMNMNGGYSFSDYEELVNRYRDSTIKPFIDRFMATVQEYRANASSDVAGNRARADYIRAMLNRIREDDTGKYLGDLLLRQTRAEVGDTYENLPDDQKKEHIDLEVALMQGSAEVVYQAEQLLGFAADSADTTWLERLSALGPDGLAAAYGDQRPTDADQDMAARYQDVATQLLQGWEEVRASLVAYDAEFGSSQGQAEAEADQPAQEGSDEVDVASYLHVDIEAPSGDEGKQPTVEEAPEVLAQINEALGAMGGSVDSVNNTRTAAIYHFLKSKPYGDGTLYDLFTRQSAEVTADNAAALYPAASCLSAGQVAALEFLPLERLLQIGATTGDAVAEAWSSDTGLTDIPQLVEEVSLYQGVDREVFSDKVALTSEALRAQALQRGDEGVVDFLSRYKTTSLLWAGTAVSALLAGVSAYKYSGFRASKEALIGTVTEAKQYFHDAAMQMNETNSLYKFEKVGRIKLESLGKSRGNNSYQITFSMSREAKSLSSAEMLKYNELKQKWKDQTIGIQEFEQYQNLNDQVMKKQDVTTTDLFEDNVGLEKGEYDYNQLMNELESKQQGYKSTTSKWSTARNVFAVATLILTVASIISTISDVVAYYNVKYTPIPKYVVDEREITTTADDGSKAFVRNDTAYYQVARTNLPREGADAILALQDYADLNGDKGKEWLALYALKATGEPILASSLKVVTGTSSIPDGYSAGVHMFGSDSVLNITDARYSYNDKANGVYAYFKREAAASSAASAFVGGNTALVGGLCLAAGGVLGAGGMYLACRRRKEPAAA